MERHATYIHLEKPKAKIRYSMILLSGTRSGAITLIVGDGGAKPKSVRAWQEVPELDRNVKHLMLISDKISEAIKEKDILLTLDGKLIGELTIDDDEDYEQEY